MIFVTVPLLDALKSASTSYILPAGTEKESLNLLKEEPDPFELERFTSMNRINVKNEYVNFISKLPGKFK